MPIMPSSCAGPFQDWRSFFVFAFQKNDISKIKRRRIGDLTGAPDLNVLGLGLHVAKATSPLRDWYCTKASYQHSFGGTANVDDTDPSLLGTVAALTFIVFICALGLCAQVFF